MNSYGQSSTAPAAMPSEPPPASTGPARRLNGQPELEAFYRRQPGSALVAAILNPRMRSLTRGNLLVLGSLVVAIPLSKFPYLRVTPWLVLPLLGIALGMADTVRCMRKRWNFYHGGVLLCLYMDLMALVLVLFLLIYPAWA